MPRSRILVAAAGPFALLTSTMLLASLVLPAQAVEDDGGGQILARTSPGQQVLVVSANISEGIYAKDFTERTDLDHFVSRLHTALAAANAPVPDVLLLQESNEASAKLVASKLSTKFGQTYVVGAMPGPGENAAVDRPDANDPSGVSRANAIVYNTGTMKWPNKPPDDVEWNTFTAPRGWVSTEFNTWYDRAYPQLRLVKNNTNGQGYLFASVHFLPNDRLDYPDAAKEIWSGELKAQLQSSGFTYAIPVFGGDLNLEPCKNSANVGDPGCTTTAEYTRMWRKITVDTPAYAPVRTQGVVEHMFVSPKGRIVDPDNNPATYNEYDKSYKSLFIIPDPARPGQTKNVFTECMNSYEHYQVGGVGRNSPYQVCREQYYSDHSFHWATFEPVPAP